MMLLVSGTTKTVGRLATRWPDRLGCLLAPRNRNSIRSVVATGLPWAIDNGAFSGFDEQAFIKLVCKAPLQPGLLFVVAPDVVGDAAATLELFGRWAQVLRDMTLPVALVGQDGLEDLDVPWDRFEAFFVGGTTPWKLSDAAASLVAEASLRGKHVHMGRVNSLRRMRHAQAIGCDSIDGSSASMFGDKYIHRYLQWMDHLDRQPVLF